MILQLNFCDFYFISVKYLLKWHRFIDNSVLIDDPVSLIRWIKIIWHIYFVVQNVVIIFNELKHSRKPSSNISTTKSSFSYDTF